MGRGRTIRGSAFAVLAFAALLVLLTVGCGDSGADDPFAGTWRDDAGSTIAVIAPIDDGYRVTVYDRTLQNAERDGDRLHAWSEFNGPDGEHSRLEAVFTRDPDSGGLVFTDPLAPGLRMELTRASGATVIPSPWFTEAAQ